MILGQAAELVAERGADGVSLRELARAAGVSHAAPTHHFGDRRGLFTALAAQGWRKLAAALAQARPEFGDAALAYVQFAIDHPGHYEVMFDRSLVNPDNAELVAAQDAAGAELAAGVGTLDDARAKEDPRPRRWPRGRWCTDSRCSGSTRRSTPIPTPTATAQRVARMLFTK